MSVRFKRFHAEPSAVFVELEGCLLDPGCMVSVNAIKHLFAERGVEISDVEASSRQERLVGTDLTCKKTQIRHVLMNVCNDKWKASKGAAPTEWDLESLFKDFGRLVIDDLRGVKPVDGAVAAISALKEQGLKVAICSNFQDEAKDAFLRTAHHYGIEPDTSMSCAEVPNPGVEGAFTCVLPSPWRCMALAARLNIFPMSTTIRVSTTEFGVEEGLNAGMWTIALAKTGLVTPFVHGSETEEMRDKRARAAFYALGAHYVIDGIWDIQGAVDDISTRMARGETP